MWLREPGKGPGSGLGEVTGVMTRRRVGGGVSDAAGTTRNPRGIK